MRLTDRDIKIIEYINSVNCTSSSQIQRLFHMEQRYQSKRINWLMTEFNIKKIKFNPIHNFYDNTKQLLRNENVYYSGNRPKSIEHDLLLNEFYIKLIEEQVSGYKVLLFDTKYKINIDGFVVIPDARVIIEYDGCEYEYLVELENNKSFNYKKYYALEQKGYICCPLLVISKRNTRNPCSNLEVINIRLNLSNMDKFLGDFMSQAPKKVREMAENIVINEVLDENESNPF